MRGSQLFIWGGSYSDLAYRCISGSAFFTIEFMRSERFDGRFFLIFDAGFFEVDGAGDSFNAYFSADESFFSVHARVAFFDGFILRDRYAR